MAKAVRQSVENRLTTVERRLDALQSVLATPAPRTDWRQSIGIFTDSPGVLEILDEAQKLREQDRVATGPRAKREKK